MGFVTLFLAGLFALGFLLRFARLFASGVVHLRLARLFALSFLLLRFASCLIALALGVLLQLFDLFASGVFDLRFAGLFALSLLLLRFASCLIALALGVFDRWLRIDRVGRARGFVGLAARRLEWNFLVRLRLFLTGLVQGLLAG